MGRYCDRPGCSEAGAVAYGMVPEDLVFWLSVPADAPTGDPGVLCQRHADAMVVPRGWTLDDRREHALRLFKPAAVAEVTRSARTAQRRRRAGGASGDGPEQLQIDGTGEIARPPVTDDVVDPQVDDEPDADDAAPTPWSPQFDHDDDLDGLLEVRSPLLARAFRGAERNR